jgi:hypothetical protein
VYDRGNSGVPGERGCKRKKNNGEISMWERGEGNRYWMEGEERRCNEMREGERKEWG